MNYASQCTSPAATKPSYRDITIRNNHYYQQKYLASQKSKIPIVENAAPFLPQELHPIIIYYATNDISTKSIKEATRTFKALLLTDKKFNAVLKTQLYTDNFIKDLAAKYHWSHQSIARSLDTPQAKHRINLQEKLRTLCCTPEGNDKRLSKTLNNLIGEGVNLEFIYNHKSEQKTPLMISMDYDNNMFKHLREYGANINGTNSLGMSPLHVAVSDPINETYCMQLITTPEIAINHRNFNGETPLLHSLIHTPHVNTNRPLVKIVKAMLKAGADPECPNKFTDRRKQTPLKEAEKLKNRQLINTIQQAIKNKKSPK